MPTQILVATADPAFGEALRAGLAEDGGYDVHLVHSGSEVLVNAASNPYAAAVLDADLPGEPFVPLVNSLAAQLPGVRLMIVPPANPENGPDLSGLPPFHTLGRPYFLPGVIETLREMLTLPDQGKHPSEKPAQPDWRANWAEDSTQAGEQLQRLLQDTSAQAAVIAFEGKIWATAGRLAPEAAQEASHLVDQGWENGRSADLARYARLETTGGEHLIYATRLLDELALELVYDAEEPLTRVHAQAAGLAAALSRLALAATQEEIPLTSEPGASGEAEIALEVQGEEEELYGEEEPNIDLSVLLAGMPPPDPDGQSLFPDSVWVHENGTAEEDILLPWERRENPSGEQAKSSTDADQDWFSVFRAEVEADHPEQHRPAPAASEKPAEQAASPDPIAALREENLTPLVPADPLERAGPAFGDLVYTCILLPKKTDHTLTGELAEKLALWIPQLCLAFGWRLEGLTVRPEYVQWVVRLSPGMSPGNVVNILRQRTSERIYSHFQQLGKLEGRNDFWAPGYLVVRGSQPPTAEQLADFIRRSRKRQGLLEE